MIFVYRSVTCCECGEINGLGLSPLCGPNRMFKPSILKQLKVRYFELLSRGGEIKLLADLWLDIVTQYSRLQLSFEKDRLPTLSGLAKRLSNRFSATYIAGL
jgi:hypothetical protein